MGFFTGFATGALNTANRSFEKQRDTEAKKDLFYTELYTKTSAELAKQEAENREKARKLKDSVVSVKNAYGLPDDDTAIILIQRSMDSKGEIDQKLLSQNAYDYSQKRLTVSRTGSSVPTPQSQEAQPNEAALNMFPEKWRNRNLPNKGQDFAQQYGRAFAKPQLPQLSGTYAVEQKQSLADENIGDQMRHRKITETQTDAQIGISKQNADTSALNARTAQGNLDNSIDTQKRLRKEQVLQYQNRLLDQVYKGYDPAAAERDFKENFPEEPVPNFRQQKMKAEVDKRANSVMALIRQVGQGTLTPDQAEKNWRVMTGAPEGVSSGIDWGQKTDDVGSLEKTINFLKTIPEYKDKSQQELYEMARGYQATSTGQVIATGSGRTVAQYASPQLRKEVESDLFTFSKAGPQLDRYAGVIMNNPNFINLQARLASTQNIAEMLNAPDVGKLIGSITLDAAKAAEVDAASQQVINIAANIMNSDRGGRLTKDERDNASKALSMAQSAQDARQRLVAAAYLRTTLDTYIKRSVEFLGENADPRYMTPKLEKTADSLNERIGWWVRQGVSPANAKEFTREEYFRQHGGK